MISSKAFVFCIRFREKVNKYPPFFMQHFSIRVREEKLHTYILLRDKFNSFPCHSSTREEATRTQPSIFL